MSVVYDVLWTVVMQLLWRVWHVFFFLFSFLPSNLIFLDFFFLLILFCLTKNHLNLRVECIDCIRRFFKKPRSPRLGRYWWDGCLGLLGTYPLPVAGDWTGWPPAMTVMSMLNNRFLVTSSVIIFMVRSNVVKVNCRRAGMLIILLNNFCISMNPRDEVSISRTMVSITL